MTFNVIIDLSGLTPEEHISLIEDEFLVGGYTDAYMTDCWYDEETKVLTYVMDGGDDFTEAELTALVLEEAGTKITEMKLERAEEGFAAHEHRPTFYELMK
jgi:hypothetical protein